MCPIRGSLRVLCGCFGGVGTGIAGGHGADAALGASVDSGVRPGIMRISTPPLTRPCRVAGQGSGRTFRPRAEGAVVAYPWEFYSTGRIFRQSVRRRGATVLIDVSGSMDLSAHAIESILNASPAAAVVATYSGVGEEGELRIVGRGNRHADAAHLEPFGCGNIIDVPALRWLARQPGSRIWISDGVVTGRHDVPAERIRAECKRICRNSGIVRVETADEATLLVAGVTSVSRSSPDCS